MTLALHRSDPKTVPGPSSAPATREGSPPPSWGLRLALFVGLLLLCGPAAADKFAGAFLNGGAGSRALGMGNAFTAVADDASALYWNPAGLASTSHNEIQISHEARFGNLVEHSFAGGVYQVVERDGRLAVGVIRLGVDGIAFTDSSMWVDENQNGIIDGGEFVYDADKLRFVTDAEYGIFVSYAQPVGRTQLGGSLKLIRQSVGSFTSFGLGIDLGVLRRDILPRLDVGLALHDATGTYLSWSTGRKETIPPVPRLGLAYRWPSSTLRGLVLLSADAELHFDNRRVADQLWSGSMSANLRWGLEFTMQNRLALRLGLDESSFQAGAGFTAGRLAFDYGIVPDVQDFDMSQRFSVRYVHGP